MAKQIKTENITLNERGGTFSAIFGKKNDKTSAEVAKVRQLLSDEKARILHTIKAKSPASIYELAKHLGRDFKAVRKDIRLLEKFGFVELISSYKNGRERLRPVVDLDQLIITINL